MQHIRDKEFDQLFKDEFEEAQIGPSSDLWDNIEKELAPKHKRIFPVYWMAAAAVVALLTAGLLFFNPTKKIGLHAPGMIARQQPKSAVPAVNHIEQVINAAPVSTLASVKRPHKTKVSSDTEKNNTQKSLPAMQPIGEIAHLDLKSLVVKQDFRQLPEETNIKAEAIITSTAVPSHIKNEVINENDQTNKKGIRNIGDLVNYVVNKVDKREDKVVQFSTDDDNSSLTGINIGMIKISQRKHK